MRELLDESPTVAPSPPAVTLGRAMLWNWWIVILAVVVCGAIGAGVALLRTPEYTATARLAVGRIDVSSPGALSGFAVATEALATGYSRTANARVVAESVSRKTGIAVDDVQDNVTATPVAKSPVFRVEATSADSEQAVELANASSTALIRYAARLNRDDPDSRRLYRQYRAANRERQASIRVRDDARAEAEARPSPAAADRVTAAQADVEADALRVDALETAYTASVQSQTATDLVQVISPATDAQSDRRSFLMIFTFIGAMAGLVLGAGIAYARESR